MKTSVIRPGLLVSLSVRVIGGATYSRTEIEPEHLTAEGAARARWETTKVITDPQEFERATKARGKARSTIAAVCAHSDFGELCPSERESELAAAIEAARAIAEEHNSTAALTRVEVYCIAGRIAQDDAEAARAIGAEVRDLLSLMEQSIRLADVGAIREAANKARSLGAMLAPDAASKVQGAIDEARRIARAIAKRAEESAEVVAATVATVKLNAIEEARFAFLDLDEQASPEPQAPTASALDFDLAPADSAPALAAVPQPSLEL